MNWRKCIQRATTVAIVHFISLLLWWNFTQPLFVIVDAPVQRLNIAINYTQFFIIEKRMPSELILEDGTLLADRLRFAYQTLFYTPLLSWLIVLVFCKQLKLSE